MPAAEMSLPLRAESGGQQFDRQSSGGTPMGVLREASRRLQASEQNSEAAQQLSMEWKDISFTIGSSCILRNVTGAALPGRLTAVLGPSGSGKTTLLNILAGRQNTQARGMSLAGDITASGRHVDPFHFRGNIAYVMQEDTLLPFETPRECLDFSACLRLSTRISQEERKEFVDNILSTLHLQNCSSTIVGSALAKGISGGEKKRTSVGVELITNPKMLFLDEPLSGLDSYAAYTLIEALKGLAQEGVPVLCTVHQPSSEIFAMFDDTVILHAGEVTYHGPADHIAAYFEKLGFPCPSNFNPADHVMFLLQKEDSAKIREIKDSWVESSMHKNLLQKIEGLRAPYSTSLERHDPLAPLPEGATADAPTGPAPDRPGFWRQLVMLTARELRGTLRNKGVLFARLGMSIFLSGLYGWLFANSASQGDSDSSSEPNCVASNFDAGGCTGDFQAHYGTLVSLAISSMMGCAQPVLLQFPQERPVFLREYAAHQYGVVPYFISKTLIEMPVVLSSQLVSFLVCYWLMGLHGNFVLLVMLSWALGMASSSLALLVGCGVASGQKAIQLAPLTLIPQMLFSGLFLPVAKIPESLRWVRYLCPLKYAINLMAIVEFEYVNDSIHDCEQSLSKQQCMMMHPGDYLRDVLIKNQSVEWDQWTTYLAALLGLLVAFRIISTYLLWRKGKYVF